MEISNATQNINITPELMARINELISHYPADKKKSALIPVLHEVQDAHDNWLSVALQNKVAEILEILPIEVYEVVTFYTMFNTKPVAKYMFEFCRTSCCATRGVEDLMDYASEKLGVKEGGNNFRRIISICRCGMFRRLWICTYASIRRFLS